MLTLNQSNDYNRHKTLAGFFAITANANIISTFPPFKSQVQDHAANLTYLETLIPNKDVITTGITGSKSILKKKIADAMVLYCGKTRAFALLNSHPELADAMKTRADLIMKMKDSDVLPFVQRAVSLITPYLADPLFVPYGVTAPLLASLSTDATTFKNSIGVADSSASTSTIANANINLAFKKLAGNLDMFDLLIHHYQTFSPDFVKGYGINASVSSIGVHHTGIHGIVSDAANKPLAGASVKIAGTDKVSQTNLNGEYSIVGVKPADAQVEVSLADFKTSITLHHFTRGHIDAFDVKLSA